MSGCASFDGRGSCRFCDWRHGTDETIALNPPECFQLECDERCKQCNQKLEWRWRFCPICGASIEGGGLDEK